jgi:hypothetical protein
MGMNRCTLLNQDIAMSPISHGDIQSTKSPLPDRGGPNYMHGPLFMQGYRVFNNLFMQLAETDQRAVA